MSQTPENHNDERSYDTESFLDNNVQEFKPKENSSDEAAPPALERSPSVLQRIQSRLSFFNPELLSARTTILKQYAFIYFLMVVCILGIFSIYWGANYNRQSRYPNLKMLVVIADREVDGVEPIIGNTIQKILDTPKAKLLGHWAVQNLTEFQMEADKRNNTLEEEITRQIHHQLYWSSIYVKANASIDFKNWVENDNSKINTTGLVSSIYETGRDFLNMNSYVSPNVKAISSMWLEQQNVLQNLFSNDTQFSLSQSKKLLTPVQFEYIDHRPFTDSVLVAPSQVGLIYLIILSFFQLNMFQQINKEVALLNLKPLHLVLYRVLTSYLSYFVLSLVYALVTLAFQVDFTKAFGKSGFLVYWMISYLTMISVGLANEVAFMVLLIICPPLVGFWLLFWVLVNISSTFTPIALTPKFYRFGYGTPVHNSYELTKVVFFDTYKGQMGRNFGILVAWVVLMTLAFVLLLKPFGKVMRSRAIKEGIAAEKIKEAQAKALENKLNSNA